MTLPVLSKRGEDTAMDGVALDDMHWREATPMIAPARDGSGRMFRGHGVFDLVSSLSGAPLRVSDRFALHVLEAIERASLAAGPCPTPDAPGRPEPVAHDVSAAP